MMKPTSKIEFNYFELIEFTIERRNKKGQKQVNICGVNVAKVREVIRLPKINEFSSRTPEVIGIFEHRGVAIPAIHLAHVIGDSEAEVLPTSQVLILEFNQNRAGFIVNSTKKIRKVYWEDILPPSSDTMEFITGMTLIENQEFLFILDFEMILEKIEGRLGGARYGVQHQEMLINNSVQKYILIVDDSASARKALKDILSYTNYSIVEARNGLEGLRVMEELYTRSQNNGVHLSESLVCLFTDIEMPQMDGYSLTQKLKADPRFQPIPVIMHSSLTGMANTEKGYKAGCNYCVAKFNRAEIMQAVEKVSLSIHKDKSVA